jgi:hypothetical protein
MPAISSVPLRTLLPEEVTEKISAFLTLQCSGCGRKVIEEAGRLCRVCGQKHCRLCAYGWNAFLLEVTSPAPQGHASPSPSRVDPDVRRLRAPPYTVRTRERTRTFYVPTFMVA